MLNLRQIIRVLELIRPKFLIGQATPGLLKYETRPLPKLNMKRQTAKKRLFKT